MKTQCCSVLLLSVICLAQITAASPVGFGVFMVGHQPSVAETVANLRTQAQSLNAKIAQSNVQIPNFSPNEIGILLYVGQFLTNPPVAPNPVTKAYTKSKKAYDASVQKGLDLLAKLATFRSKPSDIDAETRQRVRDYYSETFSAVGSPSSHRPETQKLLNNWRALEEDSRISKETKTSLINEIKSLLSQIGKLEI